MKIKSFCSLKHINKIINNVRQVAHFTANVYWTYNQIYSNSAFINILYTIYITVYVHNVQEVLKIGFYITVKTF